MEEHGLPEEEKEYLLRLKQTKLACLQKYSCSFRSGWIRMWCW